MNKISDNNFLALDLGATSGRAIIGTISNGKLEMKEINRFANPIINIHGRSYWNLFHLYSEILNSIKYTVKHNIKIISLGIDTWGVDFVCFGKDGEPLRMPYSYRDSNNIGAADEFFKRIPKETVYKKTGNQLMDINSLFQLDTMRRNESSIFSQIDKILFTPDALSYLLTGNMVTEYSIASTSQMVNPIDKKFDKELLDAVGLKESNFAPIVFSGTNIGTLSESVKHETGAGNINVVAVAGHDTASAVLAVPAEGENFAYLSSGTWSLMGVESENPVLNDDAYNLNFTNEGGADGSIRLLKNICGMWLIEQCKKEWDREARLAYTDIVREASQAEPFKCFINADSSLFTSPESMIEAIKTYCKDTNQYIPNSVGEIARCIYESLAFRYRQNLEELRQLHNRAIDKLHIIGGGSNNTLLNQFSANATRIEVVAGPCEATAMGNILLQAKAAGMVETKQEIREIVRNSAEVNHFLSEDIEEWDEAYKRYIEIYNMK